MLVIDNVDMCFCDVTIGSGICVTIFPELFLLSTMVVEGSPTSFPLGVFLCVVKHLTSSES